MTETIDLTPTPEGLRHMREMFKATAEKAQGKVNAAETMLNVADSPGGLAVDTYEEAELVIEALEALIERELGRIGSMKNGLAEIEKTGA